MCFRRMQLSLSKKDVAQLHIMLSTLPIPPLPVALTLDTSRMQPGDVKTSFDMATVQIAKDAISGDKIVNTHSIVASMSFFTTWNVEKNTDDSRRAIMHAKEAAILALIKKVIKYSETCRDEKLACTDEGVSQIFFDTTVAWIGCNMPDDADLLMTKSLDFSAITYEHPLHVAMAHYCYSQGVLYSNKNSKVCCEVHHELEARYNAKKTDEEADPVRQEHLEIAEMYSEFSYSKLLNLCYTRLLKDSLYGHDYAESDNVYENAKQLLDLSVSNYNKVINAEQKQPSIEIEQDSVCTKSPVGLERVGQATTEQVCEATTEPACEATTEPVCGATTEPACEATTEPVCAPTTEPVCEDIALVAEIGKSVGNVLDPAPHPNVEPTNTNSTADPDAADAGGQEVVHFITKPVCTTAVQSVGLTRAPSATEQADSDDDCSTATNHSAPLLSPEVNFMQLASYRSAAGIFMIELISFMKNDSMHSFENIKTNLRHLLELLQVDDPMVREACQVIDFTNLITLVKRYIAKNSPNDKHAEIIFLMDDIEQCLFDQTQPETRPSP